VAVNISPALVESWDSGKLLFL